MNHKFGKIGFLYSYFIACHFNQSFLSIDQWPQNEWKYNTASDVIVNIDDKFWNLMKTFETLDR